MDEAVIESVKLQMMDVVAELKEAKQIACNAHAARHPGSYGDEAEEQWLLGPEAKHYDEVIQRLVDTVEVLYV